MDAEKLKQAGFSPDDVSKYTELQKAGFSDTEITDYLSKGTPVNPSPEGTISTAPPKWVPWARTGAEIAGFMGGGPFGYAAAKEAEHLLPGKPPTFIHPPTPPPEQRTIMGMGREEYSKKLGVPISEEDWAKSFVPFISPESTLGKIAGKAGEVAKNIGEGYLMEAVGKIAERAIPKILPFYARGRTPGAEEVSKIAEREGITIPAADVTGSTGQAAIASAVKKLPQSSYTMQQEAEKVMEQFANYAERILAKTGGRIEPTEAGAIAKEAAGKKFGQYVESQFSPIGAGGQIPPLLHGQATQEAIAKGLEAAKSTAKELYDQAIVAAKGAPATFEKVAATIEKVQSSDRYKLLSEGGKKEVANFINLIKERTVPKVGEIKVPTGGGVTVPMQISEAGGKGFVDKGALEGVAKEANVITKFFDAEGFRKSLADKVYARGAKNTEAFGPMKDIYKAYEEDMATSAKQAGNDAFTAFKNARDFWAKDVIGTFGAPGEINFLTKLSGASPEQIPVMLEGATADELTQLTKAVSKESLAVIKRGMLTSIVNKGSVKSATGETMYNGPRIAKEIQKMGDDKLSAIFSTDEVRFLRELAQRGTKSAPMFKMGNASAEYAISRIKNAPLEELKYIKESLSPEEFMQLRQGYLTQVFEKNSKVSPTSGEIIYNGPQIDKDLFGRGGLGEVRLKTLLIPEEFEFLKNFTKVGARLGSSWRIAGNPSGTAHTLYVLHLLGQVGSAGWKGAVVLGGGGLAGEEIARGAGGGPKERAYGAAIGAFLAPYAVAKLITSNIGRQYLISGFPAMERAVGRMLPPGIIATRGVLSRPTPEPVKIPPAGRKLEKEEK